MFTIQEFFKLGMKRDIPELLDMPSGCDDLVLNVGAGNAVIPGTKALDLPDWDGDYDDIPCDDGEVSGIHAYHFLEHVNEPVRVLSEFQRVLKPGGILNVVVPHAMGMCAYQDLDHKCFFTTETWKGLFHNPHYDKNKIAWRLQVHANFIMAVKESNLCLFTQIIKY